MKQVLQNMRNGKTQVTEVPQPQVRSDMVLVRVAASLVSAGTERMLVDFASKNILGKVKARPDLARQVIDKARREGPVTALDAAFNRLDQPISLGYSSAGVVVAVGEKVTGFKPGDRVACAGQHAVHAEYNLMPVNQIAKVPNSVDLESGAFGTLGAIALNGFRLAQTQVGEFVAIIGLGLLGMITTQLAQAAGCFVLGIDLDPRRVESLKASGIKSCLRGSAEETSKAFTLGLGFDAVLICADTTSGDPVELAATISRDRGHVISIGNVGLELPRKPYYEKELFFQVSRSSGAGRYDLDYEEKGRDYPYGYVRWTEGRNLQAFLDLLDTQKVNVDSLITHRIPISQANEAYALIKNKSKPSLGVLLTYPNQSTASIDSSIQLSIKRSDDTPETKPLTAGVLGAGNYASAVFLPILKKDNNIRRMTVVSASGASALHAAKKFGFENASACEYDILENPEMTIAVILTRHNEHTRQSILALKNRKHVYCEKPLALTTTDLIVAWNAMKSSDHKLMVGFNRRFAPLAISLKSFFSNRDQPMVINYRINAGAIPLNHWTQDPDIGGGRIIGEVCHFIDFLTYLSNQNPISVITHALPDIGNSRQDNVILTFTYPDGTLGTVSYLANGDKSLPKENVEVFCGGKSAILNDFRSLELYSNSKKQSYHSVLRQDKGHHNAWEAFIASICDGSEPPIAYEQIWSTTQSTFCSIQSLISGDPISIPLPPK